MLFSYRQLRLPLIFLLFAVGAIATVQLSTVTGESAESSTIDNSEPSIGEEVLFPSPVLIGSESPIDILGGTGGPSGVPT